MADTNIYDLLAIAKTLDNINGEVIGSDSDLGMNYTLLAIGMSGQEMVDKMNSNWKATDAQFKSFNDEIAIRVISDNIQQIKEEDGVVSYTTDGENWVSLQSTWGSITGDITKQTDLYEILGKKVEQTTFNNLQTIVNKNKTDILNMVSSINTLSTNLGSIDTIVSGTDGLVVRMKVVEATLENSVSSTTIKAFRCIDDVSVEFTLDGTTWNPVINAASIEWGDIIGDINNQADLLALFNNINSQFTSVKEDITSLQDTIGDINTILDEINGTDASSSSSSSSDSSSSDTSSDSGGISVVAYSSLSNFSNADKNESTIYFISSGLSNLEPPLEQK